jgi:thiosulfate/3-mercaptopyruvate sulfurtransferase
MQSLGLGDGSRIVLYDNSDYLTAARAWWMLKTFGAHEVAILDGGFKKWQAEGRPVAAGKESYRHRHFTAWMDQKAVRTKDQLRANIDSKADQVVDARGAPRFTGEETDPRGLPTGHIPGSRNLPYNQLLKPDGTWKRGDDLRAAFQGAGIDLNQPLVTTCGSGVTAAIVLFGAALLGKKDVALYDGSWSEWSADTSMPIATGPA